MSEKAYRIYNINYCKVPSFNLLYDDKLVEFFTDKYQFFVLIDDDGTGVVVLPVEALQSALEEVTMTEDVKTALEADIKACKAIGWVRYLVTEEV